MKVKLDLDLLNEPIPAEWRATRRCPECNDVDMVVESDDPVTWGWCTTSCAKCGRTLRVDRLDRRPWEDPEWVASAVNN